MDKKFYIQCETCGEIIDSLGIWFAIGQKCPFCGAGPCLIKYYKNGILPNLVESREAATSFWSFKGCLPIANDFPVQYPHIALPPIERLHFMEKHAVDVHNKRVVIYGHRFDLSPYTHSFKDLAGILIAEVLHNLNIREYSLASTGNLACAYAHFCYQLGIMCHAHVPDTINIYNKRMIRKFGTLNIYNKPYSQVKEEAKIFSSLRKCVCSAGTFDPIRIEAKKLIPFMWYLNTKNNFLPQMPTVYIQAVSGGTGPIGVYKGLTELYQEGLISKFPKFMLVQGDKCAPMAEGWVRAEEQDFSEGWERLYHSIEAPKSSIPTLATGNPIAYPYLAKKVKKTGGKFIQIEEERTPIFCDYFNMTAFANNIGPAAGVAVQGCHDLLKSNDIVDGDVVMINIGEALKQEE